MSGIETKCSQRVGFRIENFSTRPFWTKVFTQQGVGFQIKFFGACQNSIFGFLTNISFCKTNLEYNYKVLILFTLVQTAIFAFGLFFPFSIFRLKVFKKSVFELKNFNISVSELNVFQPVKFKNTISEIPRTLDWLFYNVPDFDLNFLREKINLRKNIGLKSITFRFIISRKKRQFCQSVCFFKMHGCDQLLPFSTRFWSKITKLCQILNYLFYTRQILHQDFRNVPDIQSIFLQKSRSWKSICSRKARSDSLACTNDNSCFLFAVLKWTTLTSTLQKKFRIKVFENFTFQRIRLWNEFFF